LIFENLLGTVLDFQILDDTVLDFQILQVLDFQILDTTSIAPGATHRKQRGGNVAGS
jgi:hypothetical protein